MFTIYYVVGMTCITIKSSISDDKLKNTRLASKLHNISELSHFVCNTVTFFHCRNGCTGV